MAKSEIGAGDVEMYLQGEKIVLKPSLEACIALTTGDAGVQGIGERVGKMDIAVMCRVIRLGLGLGPTAVKDLEKRVYEEGLMKCREPLQIFIANILHGGRPYDEDETKDEAVEEGGPQGLGDSSQETSTAS